MAAKHYDAVQKEIRETPLFEDTLRDKMRTSIAEAFKIAYQDAYNGDWQITEEKLNQEARRVARAYIAERDAQLCCVIL